MAYPRQHHEERAPRPESALPVGLWVTLYFKEPFGEMKQAEGGVDYCSTYGIRITTQQGVVVYTPHINVIGAVSVERARL